MAETCIECGRVIKPGWAFTFRTSYGLVRKCLRDALRHGPMVKRSLIVCLVVGTILTLLNQGDVVLLGDWKTSFYWKIPLTYAVPFMVATTGALLNNRG